jgi:hypothetical protein
METISTFLLRVLLKMTFPVLFFVLFWWGGLSVMTNKIAIITAALLAVIFGSYLNKLLRWETKIMAKKKAYKG